MSIKYFANRVKETTVTTGNSNMFLDGAVSSYNSVQSSIGLENSFTYELLNNNNPFEWENGVGHVTLSGNTGFLSGTPVWQSLVMEILWLFLVLVQKP